MPNYAAITFTAEGATGKQRVQRAVVGRMFRDKQVLAIGGEDPVTILHYGGHMLQVPAGSILKAEHDKAKPAPKVEAPPQRRAVELTTPIWDGGPRSVTFYSGYQTHTIAVGEMLNGQPVGQIVMGDPASVLFEDGTLGLQIPGGSIVRWA